MLQMLRAEETQRDVLKNFNRAERATCREVKRAAALDTAAQGAREPNEQQDAITERMRGSRRGVAVSLTSVVEWRGLAATGAALRVLADVTVVVANTILHRAVFEWGAAGTRQHVRGAEDFRGAPWYSHIRYRSGDGSTRWGIVRVVFRSVAGDPRTCVAVQCLR